jgi:Protein phosphatase 2C
MQLDSYLSIGRTHQICEDYSLTGKIPMPFLIVSDGCSSSKNTDIGSRLLTLAAKKQLYPAVTYGILPEDSDSFGKKLIDIAVNVVDQLGVNRGALDATLILGYLRDGIFNFICYGDGAIILKTKTGNSFIQFSYGQNAPYYLTVHGDEKIRGQWMEAYPNNKLSVRTYQFTDTKNTVEQSESFYYNGFVSIQDVEMIMVTSDGIGSFCKIDDGSLVPVENVVERMININARKGEYIKRCMKKMIEGFARDGVYPLDDVSVASIAFEEGDDVGGEAAE